MLLQVSCYKAIIKFTDKSMADKTYEICINDNHYFYILYFIIYSVQLIKQFVIFCNFNIS